MAKVMGGKKDKKQGSNKDKGSKDVKGKSRAVMEGDKPARSSKSKEGPKSSSSTKSTGKKDRQAQAGVGADADGGEKELEEAALLLREIKSLGGDQADFEYLKDVDTDDEAEVAQNTSQGGDEKKLKNDLKAFMATLGDLGSAFAAQASDEEEDVEEEEEEEDAEDSEEDGGEEVEEDSEDDEPVVAPPKPSVDVKPSQTSTTAPTTLPPLPRSGMLVDPNPLWYEIALPLLPEVPSETSAPTPEAVLSLQKRGSQLLSDLSETFSGSLKSTSKDDALANSSTLSTSDRTFISTILQSGTSSDKLSALILLSSSSPLHTTPYLTQLLALTKKKSRDEAVRAIRAVVDWLKGGQGGSGSSAGLPDRKLRWFADQPDLGRVVYAREGSIKKNNRQAGDEHLLVWAFEDWLKKWYFDLLQSIETLSHDPLPFVRNQMVGFLAGLLSSKPEQEQNLLRLLVDKLGDSDKTVSSRTSYHLLQLLQAHPMMKTIIVREVAGTVLRPALPALTVRTGDKKSSQKGAGSTATAPVGPVSAAASARSADHAKYYGVITLNQIMLTRTEHDKQVANKLIEVYFDIFKDILGAHAHDAEEQGSAQEQPDLKDRKQRRDEKRGKKPGKENRDVPRKERRQAEKTQQAMEAESKMLAAVLTGVNRAFPYSEIEGDILYKRVDLLFRIIHTGTFNVCIQALMLLFQVSSRQQAVSDRFYRVLYDTLVDPRLATCSKQAMYLNLLFKAIKADTSAKRVSAFVKRITQILGVHQPPFVCGALYLLGELFNLTPSLRSSLTEPEQADDDIEMFKDAPESDGSDLEQKDGALPKPKPGTTSSSSSSSSHYDGRKRDPQYANAQNACLWEIAPLLNHFHPSVALHASQLLASAPITTTPDLELHTLSHFLDRFVYRNPKKTAGGKDSLMKPGAKGLDRSGMVLMKKGVSAIAEGRLNTDAFMQKNTDDVPVDQLFFHKFFNQTKEDQEAQGTKREKRKRRDIDDSDASDSDLDVDVDVDGLDDSSAAGDEELEMVSEGDMDEEEVWKAMKANMPAAEGDDDLLDDSEIDDDDDASVAEFAYSDSNSELGIDKDMDGNSELGIDDMDDEGIEVGDEDDVNEEDDEAEPDSAFPDEEDDEELAGFAEEDDDVFGSDEDVAIDLPELPEGKANKGKNDEKKNKKRKLKHLPAFASADDWADIINMGDSD